jgi:hypothetical protein
MVAVLPYTVIAATQIPHLVRDAAHAPSRETHDETGAGRCTTLELDEQRPMHTAFRPDALVVWLCGA